jgi:hypothetical protein
MKRISPAVVDMFFECRGFDLRIGAKIFFAGPFQISHGAGLTSDRKQVSENLALCSVQLDLRDGGIAGFSEA